MGSSGSKIESEAHSLEEFCSSGGKWSSGAVVQLNEGANEIDSSCVPCTIDSLLLYCPEAFGEEGWTGLEVSNLVAWFLVIFLLMVILKMWSECPA